MLFFADIPSTQAPKNPLLNPVSKPLTSSKSETSRVLPTNSDISNQSSDKKKSETMTTTEFLEHYEKELHQFFKNFMSAMLRADIHEG